MKEFQNNLSFSLNNKCLRFKGGVLNMSVDCKFIAIPLIKFEHNFNTFRVVINPRLHERWVTVETIDGEIINSLRSSRNCAPLLQVFSFT